MTDLPLFCLRSYW